jgi:hypothetical protein
MGLKVDHRLKCKICKTKKPLWECDICMRAFCDEHIMDLSHVRDDLGIRENKTINLMYEQHARMVCYDCMSLAELKEIDDTQTVDLPLLINRFFITDRADAYYYRRDRKSVV